MLKEKRKPPPEKTREYHKKWLAKPGNKERQKAASKAAIQKRGERDPTYKEARLEQNRQWYTANRQQVIDQVRERYHADLPYKIAHNLRVRLRIALRRFRAGKNVSAVAAGCSLPDLVAHIEGTWLPGMTWANYGNKKDQWSIDHVKPMAAFDLTLPEEQAAACHYTNLRAMWHIENLRKHSKWIPRDS